MTREQMSEQTTVLNFLQKPKNYSKYQKALENNNILITKGYLTD